MDFNSVIIKLRKPENLSLEEAQEVFRRIIPIQMDKVSEAYSRDEIKQILIALHNKGEDKKEIEGFVREMRPLANQMVMDANMLGSVDTCGTGGDKSNTFNISTASAFVAAGAGARVAKHGNRSVTSSCGSADVLQQLDVNINASKEVVGKCLREAGIAFFFAPEWHPVMKDLRDIRNELRNELGIKTIFNILGPLLNPIRVSRQVLGVFDKKIGWQMAKALLKLKPNSDMLRVFIVHGQDGLDEVTLTKNTNIIEINGTKIKKWSFIPKRFGFSKAVMADLKGGDAVQNAGIIRNILEGTEIGPKRDIVVINAAFAIWASGIVDDLKSALEQAKVSIDSGNALKKLNQLIEISKS